MYHLVPVCKMGGMEHPFIAWLNQVEEQVAAEQAAAVNAIYEGQARDECNAVQVERFQRASEATTALSQVAAMRRQAKHDFRQPAVSPAGIAGIGADDLEVIGGAGGSDGVEVEELMGNDVRYPDPLEIGHCCQFLVDNGHALLLAKEACEHPLTD